MPTEGTTRETKLTDSEAKMLRELAEKHNLWRAHQPFNDRVMAALSELLLAAKEKAEKLSCDACSRGVELDKAGNDHKRIDGTYFPCKAAAIRNSDWGDLFEVK
jgi:hypothetical protein